MTSRINTIFRLGILRECAAPAVASAATDELLTLRALIDDQLAQRADAGPEIAAIPSLGSRATALGLQHGFAVAGLICEDRYRRYGHKMSVEVDHRRDVTVWVDSVPLCTDPSLLVGLAAADDRLSVCLPRGRARTSELVAAE